VLSANEIDEILRGGYELRGFELKGPGGRNDPHLLRKVVRAALSMGNLRDGGHIVIGIDDKDSTAPRAQYSAEKPSLLTQTSEHGGLNHYFEHL
jgi:hypothetical protein